MRTPSARCLASGWVVAAAGWLAVVSTLSAGPPQDDRPGQLDVVKVERPKPLDDAELAGLPPGSQPEVLTWERAYTLALVRSRSPQPAQGGRANLAESLHPKALAEQAARFGVADFARFRTDFFAGRDGNGKGDGTFRDPAAFLFDLLRRLQVVENAQKHIDALATLKRVYAELAKAESSGLSQFDLDRVDGSLQQARRSYLDELRGYRDRLDEVKVELGLSPHAAVVPDQASLSGFRAVFDAVDEWQRNPRQNMGDLPRIVAGLPPLKDVGLDFAAVGQDPRRLEEMLRAAEQTAIKNRTSGELDEGLALRVRRRVRHLVETFMAYEIEQRGLVLALRMKDQAFEEIIAPPVDDPPARKSPKSVDLIAEWAHVLECEDRLVALWASFQSDRFALCRDLHSLPFSDWKAFYAQFATGRGGNVEVPRKAVPVPQVPPQHRP